MATEKFSNAIWMLDKLSTENPREDSIGDKVEDAFTNIKNFIARQTGGVQVMNATAMSAEEYDSAMKSTLSELKTEAIELYAQMLENGSSEEDLERLKTFAQDIQEFEENYDEHKNNPEHMKSQIASMLDSAHQIKDGLRPSDFNIDEIDFANIDIKPVEMPTYTAPNTTIEIDVDGDGIAESIELKPVEMPTYTAPNTTIEIDVDGDGIAESIELKPAEMLVGLPEEEEISDQNMLTREPNSIEEQPGVYYGIGSEDVGEPYFGLGGDNQDTPAEWLISFEAGEYSGSNSLALESIETVRVDETLRASLQNIELNESSPQIALGKDLSI